MQRVRMIWLALCLLIFGSLVGCAGDGGGNDDGESQGMTTEAIMSDELANDDELAFDATGIWVGNWVSTRALDFGFVLLNMTHTEQSVTGTVFLAESDCFTDGTFAGTLVEDTVELTADFGEGQGLILVADIEAGGNLIAGEYRVEASGTLCNGDVGSMTVVRD